MSKKTLATTCLVSLALCLINATTSSAETSSASLTPGDVQKQLTSARALRDRKKLREATALLKTFLSKQSNLESELLLPVYIDLSELEKKTGNKTEAQKYKDTASKIWSRAKPTEDHANQVADENELKSLEFSLAQSNDLAAVELDKKSELELHAALTSLPKFNDSRLASSTRSLIPSASDRNKLLLKTSLLESVHFVNIGKDGKLTNGDQLMGSPKQIDAMFREIERVQSAWAKVGSPRRIAIYFHGGLTSEEEAVKEGLQQIDVWKRNKVYPIFIVWHTSLKDKFREQGKTAPPSAMNGFLGLLTDDQIEWLASNVIKKDWEWMKSKAFDSCADIGDVKWEDPSSVPTEVAGCSIFLSRLKEYQKKHADTKINLIGFSAGSIFCGAVLEAFDRLELKPDTVSFIAPAIRIGDFHKLVRPHLKSMRRLTVFDLSDAREKNDPCSMDGAKYGRSILTMVSRALESPAFGESTEVDGSVPILGMQRFVRLPMTKASPSAYDCIRKEGKGDIYFAPSGAPLTGQTDAKAHLEFDNDVPTLNSIMRVITEKNDIVPFTKLSK
jgi:hypothetical protein